MTLLADFLIGLIKLIFSLSAVLWLAVMVLFIFHRLYKLSGPTYSSFASFSGDLI